MGEGKTLAEIFDVMVENTEVSREEVERDTIRLVQDLAAQALISTA